MATLGEQAVGSIIKIKKTDTTLEDWIVIHHGRPNPMIYPESCSGTWVMCKSIPAKGAFRNGSEQYGDTPQAVYFNGDFLKRYPDEFQSVIKTVKIPYKSTNQSAMIGENGFECKVFALSALEVGETFSGWHSPPLNMSGYSETLQYFSEGQLTEKRKSYYNGALADYWLRDFGEIANFACNVGANGTITLINSSSSPAPSKGYLPVMILPEYLTVDDSGNLILNKPPQPPTNLQVSSPILSDKPVTISWTASTDPEGALAGYIAQRKLDSGEFTEFYRGSNTKCTDSGVPFGTQKVTYRVCAYDTENLQSGFVTSEEFTVVNNHDPVIDGEDKDLGELSAAPAITYTATDEDSGDTLTSTITLDDVQLTTGTITSGEQQTYQVTAEQWLEVLNGSHTIKITVTDQNGGQAVRTLTFSKKTIKIVVENTEPVKTDAAARRIVLTLGGLFSAGSSVKVEVCNNGFDEVKSWEDATSKLTTGGKYIFINDTKTAAEWGVCWRLTIERGSADGEVWISSGSGACDD